MLDEDFEFLLVQYLDGELMPQARELVEKRLAVDGEARALAEQYRSLNAVIAAAPKVPDLHWDDFASQVSRAVVAGNLPRKSFLLFATDPFSSRMWMGGLAIAACALITSVITLRIVHHYEPTRPIAVMTPPQAPVISVADVIGPRAEPPDGQTFAEVSLQPPQVVASAFDAYPDAEGIVVRRARVDIARATDPRRITTPSR